MTAEKPVSGLASFIYQEIIAYYHYDAWGNATVVDVNGNEITDANNPAVLKPVPLEIAILRQRYRAILYR